MTYDISRPLVVAAVLLSGLALAACETSGAQGAGSRDNPLKNTSWLAEDIEGTAAAGNVQSTLNVALDNQVTGSGGCNNYFGLAVIEGDSFSMGPVGSTKMACPEVMMAQEQRFFAALTKARRFETKDGQLSLFDESGSLVLRLSRTSAE
ncbi:MAG TPA: META domain-containing protein [Kiloniellaceae bacterium]|nr:META domain-containing protein [Kiloniellaceae bacterium]